MLLLQKLLSWFYPIRIDEAKGELEHDLEVNLYRGKKYLDTANVNYSFGALQEVFDYAFRQTGIYDQHVRSALLLGFGSGSVAELLLKNCNQEMMITGVEADSEIVRLTQKHFPGSIPLNVVVIHSDATRYVINERNKYELIIIDLFIEDTVPQNCQSEEFLLLVKKLLSENGKVFFNKMEVANDLTSLEQLQTRFRKVFGTVKDIRVRRGDAENHIFVMPSDH